MDFSTNHRLAYLVDHQQNCSRTLFCSLPQLFGQIDEDPDVRCLRNSSPLEGIAKLCRWKQETSHQIIKDRLGARSYTHRKLKAIMRFLELADVAYCFLEYRRLKARNWEDSLSEIRNGLIRDFEHKIALKYDLILPKHAQKAA